jgi:Ras-related protein Rab-2A
MSNKNIQILKEPPIDCDLNFKIIIIGDSFVGKSCLSLRGTKGTFNDAEYSPTIGFEFLTFFIKIDGTIIKLQIWDTCGQEVYRSLIKSFYHNSSLGILVYSIDNKNSFDNLDSWLNEIKNEGNPDINIFLVGNKVDLESQRQVSREMGETFCKNNKIKFFLETSAKTGFNAENVFIEASKLLYQLHLEHKDRISRATSMNNEFGRNTEGISLENNNNDKLEEESEVRPRKKKCC